MTTTEDLNRLRTLAEAIAGGALVFVLGSGEARSRLSKLIATIPIARAHEIPSEFVLVDVIARQLEVRVFPRALFSLEQIERIFLPANAPSAEFERLRIKSDAAVIFDPTLSRGETLIVLGWTTVLSELGKGWGE